MLLVLLAIIALCTAIGWFLGYPLPGFLVGVVLVLFVVLAGQPRLH